MVDPDVFHEICLMFMRRIHNLEHSYNVDINQKDEEIGRLRMELEKKRKNK